MSDGGILDMLLAFVVVIGVLAMFYMAYRQQGILETVNEIRDIFKEKVDDAREAMPIYR